MSKYFRELITEQFLIYIWNKLKFDFGYGKVFEPISKDWFRKCAFLLQKGLFSYEDLSNIPRDNLKVNGRSLKLFKYKIIEGAVLAYLQINLEADINFENINSTKYVCK